MRKTTKAIYPVYFSSSCSYWINREHSKKEEGTIQIRGSRKNHGLRYFTCLSSGSSYSYSWIRQQLGSIKHLGQI